MEKIRMQRYKNPRLGKGIWTENGTKNEILSFCQFFSFGIKID